MQRNQLEQLWGRASQWTGSKVKKRAVHNKRETDGTAWMRASESSVMGTEALTGSEWTEVKTGAICRHLTKLFLIGRLGPRNSSCVSSVQLSNWQSECRRTQGTIKYDSRTGSMWEGWQSLQQGYTCYRLLLDTAHKAHSKILTCWSITYISVSENETTAESPRNHDKTKSGKFTNVEMKEHTNHKTTDQWRNDRGLENTLRGMKIKLSIVNHMRTTHKSAGEIL